MPIHRIPRATMHEDVRELEHDGERIVSVAPDSDPAFVLIGTRFVGQEVETRPAGDTHQARLGLRDVHFGFATEDFA